MINLPTKQAIAVGTMFEWTPPNGFANRLEMTHTCVVALVMADAIVKTVNDSVTKFCIDCVQSDGGFNDGHFEHSEIEAAFSAVRALNLLGTLDMLPDREKTISWVLSKQNSDGGFGAMPDWGDSFRDNEIMVRKESTSPKCVFEWREDSSAHAAYFAFGTLEPLQAVDRIDLKKLGKFLLECQDKDGSWGYFPDTENGDNITICFALDMLSKLNMLNSIDKEKIINWILECQQDDGSFGPYPGFPGPSLIQPLWTARAAKSLRILNAFHRIDEWRFENYWNNYTIKTGWDAVCMGLAVGHPLVNRER
jgi:prenyltransferase beta subunit